MNILNPISPTRSFANKTRIKKRELSLLSTPHIPSKDPWHLEFVFLRKTSSSDAILEKTPNSSTCQISLLTSAPAKM
ncbi:hypothetical protein YC2023_054174 [Brassica napus]